MSNTPSKAEIEALVKRHGATSYRNRADTQHPAYGFTEDGLNGLIDEVLAKWAAPQQEAQEPALFVSAKQLADLVDPSHATGGSYLPARKTRAGLFTQPLYTAPHPPPAPAPLTDAQIAEMMRDTWGCASIAPRHALQFARAVERAHGITKERCPEGAQLGRKT